MTDTTAIQLPLARLAITQIVAAAAVVALGAGLSMPFATGVAEAAVPALVAVLVGIIVGIGFLKLLPARSPADLPMRVLFAGAVRMFAALGMGLWCWFAFDPARVPFWLLFLAGALAALVAEVMSFLPVLRGVESSGGAVNREAA